MTAVDVLSLLLTALGGMCLGVAFTASWRALGHRGRRGRFHPKLHHRGARELDMPTLPPIEDRRPELVAERRPVDLFSLVPAEGRA